MNPPVRLSSLQTLQVLLHEVGLDTYFITPEDSPNQPYEQLWVTTAATDGQAGVLRLYYANDAFKTGLKTTKVAVNANSPVWLHFVLVFPVIVPPAKLVNVAHLAMVCNRFLPDGALGVTPEDGLYLRHVLLHEDRQVSLPVVAELCHGLLTVAHQLAPWIHQVLTDEQPLPVILTQIIEQGGFASHG